MIPSYGTKSSMLVTQWDVKKRKANPAGTGTSFVISEGLLFKSRSRMADCVPCVVVKRVYCAVSRNSLCLPDKHLFYFTRLHKQNDALNRDLHHK